MAGCALNSAAELMQLKCAIGSMKNFSPPSPSLSTSVPAPGVVTQYPMAVPVADLMELIWASLSFSRTFPPGSVFQSSISIFNIVTALSKLLSGQFSLAVVAKIHWQFTHCNQRKEN